MVVTGQTVGQAVAGKQVAVVQAALLPLVAPLQQGRQGLVECLVGQGHPPMAFLEALVVVDLALLIR
jgi:hypothetical protein